MVRYVHPISNISLAFFLLASSSALSPITPPFPSPISTGPIGSPPPSSAALLLLSNSFFSSTVNGSPISTTTAFPLPAPSSERVLSAPNSAFSNVVSLSSFFVFEAERLSYQNARNIPPMTSRAPKVLQRQFRLWRRLTDHLLACGVEGGERPELAGDEDLAAEDDEEDEEDVGEELLLDNSDDVENVDDEDEVVGVEVEEVEGVGA